MRQPATATEQTEKSFTGADLEQRLAAGEFDQAAAQLVGMVKSSTEQGHISFAPAGCDSWVDIPSEMIEDARRVGHQTCRDHSHPVFRLSLKEPGDPQAKVFQALLSGYSTLQGTSHRDEWEHGPSPDFGGPGLSARMISDDFGDFGSLNDWNCKNCKCRTECHMERVPHLPGQSAFRRVCKQVCECTDCKESIW